MVTFPVLCMKKSSSPSSSTPVGYFALRPYALTMSIEQSWRIEAIENNGFWFLEQSV